MIVIKKYKNRKLYDKLLSKYITLPDVDRYKKEGRSYKVLDVDNKDITDIITLRAEYEVKLQELLNEKIS